MIWLFALILGISVLLYGVISLSRKRETAPRKRYQGVGKMAAVSAAILLVSCGLCGAGFYFHPNDYVTFEGIFGLIGVIVGAIGLLAAAVTAVVDFFDRTDRQG